MDKHNSMKHKTNIKLVQRKLSDSFFLATSPRKPLQSFNNNFSLYSVKRSKTPSPKMKIQRKISKTTRFYKSPKTLNGSKTITKKGRLNYKTVKTLSVSNSKSKATETKRTAKEHLTIDLLFQVQKQNLLVLQKRLACKFGNSPFAEIEPFVMASLMRKRVGVDFDNLFIVDCRTDYEFHGGHLIGAEHIQSEKDVHEFYKMNIHLKDKTNIFVFHCEYSSQRAPKMAQLFRQIDRESNEYPFLTYPFVFLLGGGYKNFFEKVEGSDEIALCTPRKYVSMFAAQDKKTVTRIDS